VDFFPEIALLPPAESGHKNTAFFRSCKKISPPSEPGFMGFKDSQDYLLLSGNVKPRG
jgi:hypothetical protein